MSIHKSEAEVTADEILQRLEQRADEIAIEREQAGLPPVDGVELQREYKNRPVSPFIEDYIKRTY